MDTTYITLIVCAFTLYYTRKNLKTSKYIDTITSERIKWIATIRNEVTDIVTNIYFTLKIYSDGIEDIKNQNPDYENDIDARYARELRYFDSPTSTAFGPETKRWSQGDFIKNLYLFKIRLNQNEDKVITGIIDYFIQFYAYSEYKSSLENTVARENVNLLITHIQELLKQEWNNVKNESNGKITR